MVSYDVLPTVSEQAQPDISDGSTNHALRVLDVSNEGEDDTRNQRTAHHEDRFCDDPSEEIISRFHNNRFRHFFQTISSTERYAKTVKILNHNLFPDTPIQVRGVQLVEHSAITKLFKLISITILMIYATYKFVRIERLDWEHDVHYSMKDFFVYDLHHVMLDTITFFVIGRLFLDSRPGVDHLSFFLPLLCGVFYPSWSSTFGFLQHSVSMYEIMCRWPFALFEYVIGIAALNALLIFFHIKYSYREGVLLQKCIEVFFCLMVFVVPYATQPSFHLHHW